MVIITNDALTCLEVFELVMADQAVCKGPTVADLDARELDPKGVWEGGRGGGRLPLPLSMLCYVMLFHPLPPPGDDADLQRAMAMRGYTTEQIQYKRAIGEPGNR